MAYILWLLAVLHHRYSPELAKLIVLPFQERCNIYDLLAQASRGLLNEVDSLYAHSDALEEHLGKQFESERVSRLLMKMSLINERPQVGGKLTADAWSETGDRYLIKLFRDYVFHQTDEHGRPWMDLGHIIDCLNKLDVGSDERVLLNSRNGKSFFVVTYQDVRRCIEEAFQELVMS
jgi:PAB-dependent poly(A)-specific ribonuclease subunit 3